MTSDRKPSKNPCQLRVHILGDGLIIPVKTGKVGQIHHQSETISRFGYSDFDAIGASIAGTWACPTTPGANHETV